MGAGLLRSRLVGILKEHEAGAATAALCRQHGISEQTFSRWTQTDGGFERGEATRLKVLAEENARLNRMAPAESQLTSICQFNDLEQLSWALSRYK